MKLKEWLRDNTGLKILAVSLVCFIMPMLILSISTNNRSSEMYMNWSRDMAQDIVTRTVSQVEYRLGLYQELAETIANNEELSSRIQAHYTDVTDIWEAYWDIESSFSYVYRLLPGINLFRVYFENDTVSENGGVMWQPGSSTLYGNPEKEWYRQTLANGGTKWSSALTGNSGTAPYVILTSCIGSDGIVYMRLKPTQMLAGSISATQYSGARYVITDENGLILAATDTALAGKQLSDTDFEWSAAAEGTENPENYEAHMLLSNGWQIYASIPLGEIGASSEAQRRTIAAGTAVILIFACLGIITVNYIHTDRQRRLSRHIRNIMPGQLENGEVSQNADHLKQAEHSFDLVVGEVSRLNDEVESSRISEMREQVRSMESYINPHFLYNTLGLIRWKALDDDDEELCELIDDMTTYYRLSLNGGRSSVLVDDEIKHLKAYTSIQQKRYGESVNVTYDLDDDAMMSYVPKNILQTIVENSYVHGIEANVQQNEICISVKRYGKEVLLQVTDNGAGIPPEKLAELNRDEPSAVQGIGLMSVKARLHLFYGSRARMTISSVPCRETVVAIRIPYEESELKIGD